MLQGKKAYICSPLSAPDPEGVQHNMELAKYYLMQMKRLYHCRTFASHAHLPLMLDDRIPEERETAMQIGALMLDLCEVLPGCEISEAVVPSGKSYRQDYQPDCSLYGKYGSRRSQNLFG